MANKWVYLVMVSSCAIATGWVSAARCQEEIEGAPVPQPGPGDIQVPAAAATEPAPSSETAPSGETAPGNETAGAASGAATAAAPQAAQNQASEVAAPVAPGQSGGFVQRLSERLNGANPGRSPVPAANRDPRADLLDTSFPAEQPEVVEPEAALGSNANSRPTQARTANGVTELSNRADLPVVEPVSALSRTASIKPSLSRPQVNTDINNPRLESQVSLPTTSIARTTSSTSPWLWVLAGTAALLLIPIAFLLTRPTR